MIGHPSDNFRARTLGMTLAGLHPIPRIDTGCGRITLRAHGSTAVFSELSSTYPLKLLSPRIAQDGVAVVYVLTYGGGLVGGDCVKLVIDVGHSATLVLLSQGSTKVFKTRHGDRAAHPPESKLSTLTASGGHKITKQHLDVVVSDKGALFLLPDPVTCFRSASYTQTQTFHLSDNASLVVLDWVTSGRKSLGEEWVFSRYYSANEIWVDGKRAAKDVMLLEDPELDAGSLPRRTLFEKLSPYSCYATVILYGPLVHKAVCDITTRYEAIIVFKTSTPAALIWSLSLIAEGKGCVVRIAGEETELVRLWLGDVLRRLEDLIGVDVFRRAFA